MLWIPATVLASALLTLTSAQNPPPCAQSCLATTRGVLSCATGDDACVCGGNGTFNGHDVFFGCSATVCEEEDEDDARDFFRTMCAAVSSSRSSTYGTTSTDGSPAPSSDPNSHNNGDNGGGSGKNGGDGGGGGGGRDVARTRSSPNVGAIVGGTIGGVVLLVLLVLLYVLYRRRRARRYDEYEASETDWHSDAPETMNEARHVSQLYSDTVTHPAEYVTSPTTVHARNSLLYGPGPGPSTSAGVGKSPLDDLTAAQKDLVQMMLERGAAPSSVESVVERMRAENRGEADPPPQYEFLDAKGHLVITPSSPED